MALLDKSTLAEQNKKDLEKVKSIINEEGLAWNWESIHYTLFKEEVDWETLRVYDGKFRNILVILMAGMPEDKRSRSEAFRILGRISDAGIHPIRLHKFLVEILQERHFFMGTKEEELAQNLIEADLTDAVLLQNLILHLISKEAGRKSFQLVKDSLVNQENSMTEQ